MLKRFLTSVVIVVLLIAAFALRYVSPYIFDAFLGVIVLGSAYEVSKSFSDKGKKCNTYFVLAYPLLNYISLVLCINLGASMLIYFAISIALMIVIFATTFIVNLCSKNKINKEMADIAYKKTETQYIVKKSMLNLFLMLYPSFILSMFFVINHLKGFAGFASIEQNAEMLLLVVTFVTTIMTDTFAYLIGGGIGGKKLCPKISPNKTISGAIGGLLSSVFSSLLLFLIFGSIGSYHALFTSFGITIWHFAIYGVFASILSQCGDIFASYIKRINGIKDYGTIFPGHGGFMDRVDGLSFNVIGTLIFALILFL